MNPSMAESIKSDFLEWSGGFPPESEDQITVYVDYADPSGQGTEDVRRTLRAWMNDEE